MNSETKVSLFLFIYFFLFYSLFIHWPGWNENSRFFLTRAIVDNYNLTIDPWYNETTDRAYYNGHYYSDKPPGTSILGLPIYWAVEKIYGKAECKDFFHINYAEAEIAICKNINPAYSISMVLLSLTSSFFGSMLVSLFFISTKNLTKNREVRLFASLILGLTSPLLPSSQVFQECAGVACFSFASFYFFEKKQLLISSALLSIAIIISYGAALIIIFSLVYAWLSKKYKITDFTVFLVFLIILTSPIVIYNFKIFNSPLRFTLQYNDRSVWKVSQEELNRFGLKSLIPDMYVILALLILPSRGFLFFFPVYLFTIPGFFYLKRRYALSVLVLLMIFLYYFSCREFWWGGYFFGPKYFSYFIPFLTLPLLPIIEKSRSLVLPLFLISLVLSLSSLTWWEDLIDFSSGKISEKINSQIHSLSLSYNPFKEHYLPYLITYGPISRISVSILKTHSIDIRDTPYSYDTSEYAGFKKQNAAIISFMFAILLLFLLYFERKHKK